ncbi:MAG: phage major capsid protein [Actinomycetota bacterium]|nr:phage major capsid protein [Actinomycetota bacterium]
MTVEEILSALQAIIDGAKAEDGAERPLTEEEAERYEDLERQLKVAQKSAEIVARQAAYKTVVAPAVNFGAANRKVDEYERAFESFVRTGQKNSDLIQRAQSEAVGSAGGFLVPDSWRDKIVEKLVSYGGLMNAAEKLNTSDGRPLMWITNDEAPTTATAGNYAEITPENELWDTGADLAFGTRSLGAFKYTTVGASSLPLKVSYELLQDSAFDLRGFIAKKFADRIARKLARDLILGTGVNEPQGIISTQGGIASTTARAAAAPTYAELLAVVHSLDPAYREGASWLMNDATLALVRGIVDGANRPLLWNTSDDLSGSLKGMTLLGYPVVIDQAMPTSTDASANKSIVFGNLKDAYVVREVKAFEMVVLNELYAQYGQVGFMGWARYDGMVQDPNAAVISPND